MHEARDAAETCDNLHIADWNQTTKPILPGSHRKCFQEVPGQAPLTRAAQSESMSIELQKSLQFDAEKNLQAIQLLLAEWIHKNPLDGSKVIDSREVMVNGLPSESSELDHPQ